MTTESNRDPKSQADDKARVRNKAGAVGEDRKEAQAETTGGATREASEEETAEDTVEAKADDAEDDPFLTEEAEEVEDEEEKGDAATASAPLRAGASSKKTPPHDHGVELDSKPDAKAQALTLLKNETNIRVETPEQREAQKRNINEGEIIFHPPA